MHWLASTFLLSRWHVFAPLHWACASSYSLVAIFQSLQRWLTFGQLCVNQSQISQNPIQLFQQNFTICNLNMYVITWYRWIVWHIFITAYNFHLKFHSWFTLTFSGKNWNVFNLSRGSVSPEKNPEIRIEKGWTVFEIGGGEKLQVSYFLRFLTFRDCCRRVWWRRRVPLSSLLNY